MAWTYFASRQASSSPSNAATTSAMSTTGATLLVVSVANATSGGVAVVTDSQSNSWTALTKQDNAGSNGTVQMFYVLSPSTSASHTFTAGAQAAFGMAITVAAFTGTAAFDAENGSATTSDPGTVTCTGAGQLLIAACQDATGSGPEASLTATNSTVITIEHLAVSGGVHFGLGTILGYPYNGAGGAAGIHFTAGSLPSSVIATFTLTTSGGGSGGAYGFA